MEMLEYAIVENVLVENKNQADKINLIEEMNHEK